MMNDRMMDDRMMNDRTGTTRIHSMRNPPDIFVPDECIKDRQKRAAQSKSAAVSVSL
jgi:hypothetical protein